MVTPSGVIGEEMQGVISDKLREYLDATGDHGIWLGPDGEVDRGGRYDPKPAMAALTSER